MQIIVICPVILCPARYNDAYTIDASSIDHAHVAYFMMVYAVVSGAFIDINRGPTEVVNEVASYTVEVALNLNSADLPVNSRPSTTP
jgi:hypothetical protein